MGEEVKNTGIELTLAPKEVSDEQEKEKVALMEKQQYDYNKSIEELAELSEEEKNQVMQFASQVDVSDSKVLVNYGAASQQKIAEFSDTALENVKAKDLGEVGDMLTNLVVGLKEDPSEQRGFLGFFKKKVTSLDKLKAKYMAVEKDVDKVSDALTNHRNTLIKDITMLDSLYDTNLQCFKEITMYILAGKQAIKDAKDTKLAELRNKAEETKAPQDVQAAADFADAIDRFEKKLYDLELTRTVNMQIAPQIRLIQNNDIVMSEKIQSTIVNTIPLWKNQMVITLSLANTKNALEAESAVTNATNDILKKNAEALKMGTVEAAKASERGIVDIETLKETNQKLIETLEEVTHINKEGRAGREKAESELAAIEAELKTKLLEMSK